jgi:hypothetical protein
MTDRWQCCACAGGKELDGSCGGRKKVDGSGWLWTLKARASNGRTTAASCKHFGQAGRGTLTSGRHGNDDGAGEAAREKRRKRNIARRLL